MLTRLTIILSISLFSVLSYSEIADPATVNAYKLYWNNFDQYESSRINDTKETISQSWDQLKKEFHQSNRSLSELQLSDLKAAAKKYRDHLEKFREAKNTPFVLLNLAQILNNIGHHYQEFDASSGMNYRSQALEILSDISKRYPNFEKREEVLYLKATILDSIERKESAYKTWIQLAKIAKKTIFGAHAHIAIGDHKFNKERPSHALQNYKRALSIIKNLKIENQDYEILRTQYRIAWASYRSANLNQCINTGIELLQPGRTMKKLSIKQSIERDAIDLIADALYEKNNMEYIKSNLENKILRNHASAISLRILKQYLSAGVYTNIIELGEFSVEKFPRSRDIPDILSILAQAYQKIKNEDGQLQALEKLSLLLPKNSLWRSLYKDEFSTIKNMETKALAASELLAAHYYKLGMTNASPSSFKTSSSYYQNLIDHNKNHSKANDWRLKQANSYYFSSDLNSAKKTYKNLIDGRKVDQKTLQVAGYQLVLTHEKDWREKFGKQLSLGKKPYNDPTIKKELLDFEEAARSFSNRFTTSKFAIDALLKVASANRDMQNLEQASKYWQRVLVSNPNPSQRSLAIRGIVFQKVQDKNPIEIIKTTTKFLKLENWDKLRSGLRKELEGILSQAVTDASDMLNSKGNVLEAGDLLISISEDFPQIPRRDELYRDGIYMLAIAGDWARALKYSDIGLGFKNFKYKADLSYLKGRSLEYQMRFREAAQAYLDMASKYPAHSRADLALTRAEALAIAEDDLVIAAKANAFKGRSIKGASKKLKYYGKAAILYSNADNHQHSLTLGKRALNFAKRWNEKLPVMLINAKQRYALGSEVRALREYNKVRRLAQLHKSKIDSQTYMDVVGESSFLLGEDQRARFNEFRIRERRRSWTYNVKEKTKHFDRLYAAYESAINSGHPIWSSKSRYYVANSAEKFSREINESLISDNSLNPSRVHKLKDQSNRFKNLAQKLYSDNLMEKNKRPKEFRNNPWIKKSIIKLSRAADNKALKINDEKLPYSMGSFIPQQWSL